MVAFSPRNRQCLLGLFLKSFSSNCTYSVSSIYNIDTFILVFCTFQMFRGLQDFIALAPQKVEMHIYVKINYSDRIRNLVLNDLGINNLVYRLLQLSALPTFSFHFTVGCWAWVRKTSLRACPQSSHPIQRSKEMLLHLSPHACLTHMQQKGLWIFVVC